MALTLAQQQAIALASARARAAAAPPSGPQPTFMQDVAASPVGRLVHDAVVQPVEGMASLALKAIPGANLIAPAFDKSTQQVAEKPYEDALSAQRNVPGYAEARANADRVTANRGVGFTDQVTAPFNSAMAGTVGGLFGGSMTAANAASDSQEAAQADYQKTHPYLATAGQILGGLAAAPESAKVPMPALPAKQAVPTIADLKTAARTAYDKVDNSGAMISGPSYDTMTADLQAKLAAEGIDPTLHPNSLAAYKRVAGQSGKPVTMKGLDTMRRVAGDAISASVTNPSDKRMGYIIQNHIDDFVNGLQPTDIIGGTNPQATVDALNEARDMWSRASQAGVIQKQLDKATIKAGQYSQSGMENATRAQFRQLALNDKAMSRLSPEVQAAVKQVAAGTASANTLRFLGKFAPHGPVSTAISVGLGGTLGGLPGAMALPIAGEAARFGAAALTKSAAQRAMDAALLGKTPMPRLNVPPLQIPSLTPASTVPYGLFGSMGYQPQPQ